MRKTDDLIHSLSSELTPVTPVKSPGKTLFICFVISVLSLIGAIFIMGVRENLQSVAPRVLFWLQNVSLFIVAVSGIINACLMSIPGRGPGMILRTVPFIAFFVWFALILPSLISVESQMGRGLLCVADLLFIGAAPLVVLFKVMRKGAVLERGKAGVTGLLGVAALGALGSQFVCSSESPMHLIVWHFLPVLFLGTLGFIVGNKFFKKI
ncbi:MAG: NrsF family protein [Bacteriovoracia bacterium]